MAKHCILCHTRLQDKATFCSQCGATQSASGGGAQGNSSLDDFFSKKPSQGSKKQLSQGSGVSSASQSVPLSGGAQGRSSLDDFFSAPTSKGSKRAAPQSCGVQSASQSTSPSMPTSGGGAKGSPSLDEFFSTPASKAAKKQAPQQKRTSQTNQGQAPPRAPSLPSTSGHGSTKGTGHRHHPPIRETAKYENIWQRLRVNRQVAMGLAVLVGVVLIAGLGGLGFIYYTLNSVERLINNIELPALPEPNESNQVVEKDEGEWNNSGAKTICTTTEYSISDNLSEMIVVDQNAAHIWPGALVQGNSLEGGFLAGINLERTPGTITINGVPLSLASAEIENPNQATVQQAINDLLPDEPIAPAAQIAYTTKESYSLAHGLLSVGVYGVLLPAGIFGELEGSIGATHERESLIIKFTQPYYTVTFNDPKTPSDFFNNVTLEQAQTYMGEGNPPAYVSSVTYGRMLLALATSTRSATEVEAALRVSLGLTGGEASVNAGAVFEDTEMKLIALGGDPVDVTRIITQNDFKSYFENGALLSKSSPAAPIAYRINYLHNNHVAMVNYLAQYQQADCETVNLPPPSIEKVVITSNEDGTKHEPSHYDKDVPMYFNIFVNHPIKGTDITIKIERTSGIGIEWICQDILNKVDDTYTFQEVYPEGKWYSLRIGKWGGNEFCNGTYEADIYLDDKYKDTIEFRIIESP